ncbi:hypothetical protein ACJRO7_008660 [Eucalyptus globulus]|uniref:Uncharacterized protein n=1 Tax=Eucalyptus globulus TaxID=34317 RepID=A0ABD3ISY8_EUCGL
MDCFCCRGLEETTKRTKQPTATPAHRRIYRWLSAKRTGVHSDGGMDLRAGAGAAAVATFIYRADGGGCCGCGAGGCGGGCGGGSGCGG